MKRFFIVCYVASAAINDLVTGTLDVTTEDRYPSKKWISDTLIKTTDYPSVRDVVITNIIELSEADFNHWKEKV